MQLLCFPYHVQLFRSGPRKMRGTHQEPLTCPMPRLSLVVGGQAAAPTLARFKFACRATLRRGHGLVGDQGLRIFRSLAPLACTQRGNRERQTAIAAACLLFSKLLVTKICAKRKVWRRIFFAVEGADLQVQPLPVP